jgi:hypothetical protein
MVIAVVSVGSCIVKCLLILLLFLCDGLGGLFVAQQLEQDPLTIDFNSAEPLDSVIVLLVKM